jgi:hypothetical protein
VELPDPKDRHVLAAAIHGRADVIVTYNLKDFPVEVLETYGLHAQHPDEFIGHLIDLAPNAVVAAAKAHRQSLRNPAKSVAEYLDTLERQALAETVAALRDYAALL